jgi:hypothetical protein
LPRASRASWTLVTAVLFDGNFISPVVVFHGHGVVDDFATGEALSSSKCIRAILRESKARPSR